MGEPNGSVWHLIVVWVLVGSSFVTLGAWTAASFVHPFSDLGVGLVFGTGLVAVGWIAGYRPSVPAGLVYFSLEQLVALVVELVIRPAWPCAVTAVASIAIAGVVVFGGAGQSAIAYSRPVVRRLLRVSHPSDQ